MLEIKSVTKSYGKKENVFHALKKISLTIEEGKTYAIVGKSGSGKSTLLHILTGLDHPTTGDVTFLGKSIFTDFNTDQWRAEHIGVVFQQFFLQPNDSVMDNVSLPLKIQGRARKERTRSALEALKRVGLTDKASNKANDLSGGQKQRVAIARALVSEPSLLIADEPTGNLDSENGAVVENLLFELQQKYGTTIVIVTHDEDLAQRCQFIVRVKDGEIVAVEDKSKKASARTKGGKS